MSRYLQEEYSDNNTIEGTINNIYDKLFLYNDGDIVYEFDRVDGVVKISNAENIRKHPKEFIYSNLINIDETNLRLSELKRSIMDKTSSYCLDFYSKTKSSWIYSKHSSIRTHSKAYVPIDKAHYEDAACDILDLQKEFVRACKCENLLNRKVGEFKMRINPASDGYVFRFATKKQEELFKDIVKDHTEILSKTGDGLPFMQKEDGIAYIYDSGGSYHSYLSEVIYRYVISARKRGIKPDIVDFRKYVEGLKPNYIMFIQADKVKTALEYNDYLREVVKQEESKTL